MSEFYNFYSGRVTLRFLTMWSPYFRSRSFGNIGTCSTCSTLYIHHTVYTGTGMEHTMFLHRVHTSIYTNWKQIIYSVHVNELKHIQMTHTMKDVQNVKNIKLKPYLKKKIEIGLMQGITMIHMPEHMVHGTSVCSILAWLNMTV